MSIGRAGIDLHLEHRLHVGSQFRGGLRHDEHIAAFLERSVLDSAISEK